MAFQQPRKERIQGLSNLFMQELEKARGVEITDANKARAVFVNTILESLREEEQLEKEVEETLRRHGQKIYEKGADFQKMLHDGKRILAKKRGFVL